MVIEMQISYFCPCYSCQVERGEIFRVRDMWWTTKTIGRSGVTVEKGVWQYGRKGFHDTD